MAERQLPMFYSATLIRPANFLKHFMHQHSSFLPCLIMTLLINPAHICILSNPFYIRLDMASPTPNLPIATYHLTLIKLREMVRLKYDLKYEMPAKRKEM